MIQMIYSFFLYPLLLFGFWILSFRNKKIKKGFELRKNRAWIKEFDKTTPWVWFHVASGELEYAKPVMRELKKISQCKILVTYFSPSILGALKNTPEIDLFVPMPWDTPWSWNTFLNHYKPRCLAIARTDTWPNMVWQTKKKGLPSILFSATLPKTSGRYSSFWGRLFYGQITEAITRISCVTEEDQDHFLRLNEEQEISIGGDTRFDQVVFRLQENREIPESLKTLKRVFVAGSTWPEDEKILLPALKDSLSLGLTAIIAPHEPTPQHLENLEKILKHLMLQNIRYSNLGAFSKDVPVPPIIIVDKVGVLADLYKISQIAFVGGSFKKSVHSVMEPAGCGARTLFGPYHFNNREALALKEKGLAREIVSAQELEQELLETLKMSDVEIQKRQNLILSYVKSQTGVSQTIATWIHQHSH